MTKYKCWSTYNLIIKIRDSGHTQLCRQIRVDFWNQMIWPEMSCFNETSYDFTVHCESAYMLVVESKSVW